MKEKDCIPFNSAIAAVNKRIKDILLKLDEKAKCECCEIRLRSNRPVVFFSKKGSLFLCSDSTLSKTIENSTVICTAQELIDSFSRMCGYSLHTHQTSLNNGFVTLRGGHRAGVAGTAVCSQSGDIVSIRDISSINIRVARQIDGCSKPLAQAFFKNGAQSIIIAGPPSSGKTTVLRDLAKRLSSGLDGNKCYKVALIDEREELAASEGSVCGYDIGLNCDVLNDYPKKKAIMLSVRTLSPEIIICDEIGSDDEVEALRYAVNTGVKFVVTIHAADYEELISRPQIKKLLETYSFNTVVLLKGAESPGEVEATYKSEELINEINRRSNGVCVSGNAGNCNISSL